MGAAAVKVCCVETCGAASFLSSSLTRLSRDNMEPPAGVAGRAAADVLSVLVCCGAELTEADLSAGRAVCCVSLACLIKASSCANTFFFRRLSCTREVARTPHVVFCPLPYGTLSRFEITLLLGL